MSAVEYACTFARATGDRLLGVERLVLALPRLVGPALQECDLAFRRPAQFLAVTIRAAPGGLDASARARLAFWCARTGGRASALSALPGPDANAFRAALAACELRANAIPPPALFEVAGRIFTEAGAPGDRARSVLAEPVLATDVGGPGWEGATYTAAENTLFLATPLAPPVGDELALAFRVPGVERPLDVRGIVLDVRPADRAGPGAPAGFTIGLWSPPTELHRALVRHAAGDAPGARAAPRFHVAAPVRIVPARPPGAVTPRQAPEPGRPPDPPPAAARGVAAAPSAPTRDGSAPPVPRALVEYATDQQLAADWIENLSQGGAFVRTPHPSPQGAPVELELRLPNGAQLHARATVVFTSATGMGVRFALDAENEEVLSAAIAHISARPRRALLVDDDALVRRMLSDALAARGFEVVTAGDGAEGLGTLADELLGLDLLVTDVRMPGMDGEAFVRTIRTRGGESELAIVAVTGRLDGDVERRLEAAGADAVLDKALGPELIAQASDAVVERKRLATAPA